MQIQLKTNASGLVEEVDALLVAMGFFEAEISAIIQSAFFPGRGAYLPEFA